MPAESRLPLRLQLPPQDFRRSRSSTPSPFQQVSPNARPPRRRAAIRARTRVSDAYALYASTQDPPWDSGAPSRRPSALQLAQLYPDDSSDSDIFVDDSESDCPRRIKRGRGKDSKRSASPVMNERERRRRNIAGKSSRADDREQTGDATGFMVRSGNVVRNILRDKARRAPGAPPRRLWKKTHVPGPQVHIRRAGLSDMSPDLGGYISEWDEVRTEPPEGPMVESRVCGTTRSFGGSGYRALRFQGHL